MSRNYALFLDLGWAIEGVRETLNDRLTPDQQESIHSGSTRADLDAQTVAIPLGVLRRFINAGDAAMDGLVDVPTLPLVPRLKGIGEGAGAH